MDVNRCEMNSLSDLSNVDSEQEDFEFVENETKAKLYVSEEARFIAQYKSYVGIADAYRHKENICRKIEMISAQKIQQYLNEKMPSLYSSLKISIEHDNNSEDGDWILTTRPSDIDSTLNANLRMLQKGSILFAATEGLDRDSASNCSNLHSQLETCIRKLKTFGNNLNVRPTSILNEDEKLEQLPQIKKDAYLAEQHLFDYKMLKKSLNVVKNILNTTTAEKFTIVRSYEQNNVYCDELLKDGKKSNGRLRTVLFSLLDHLKRWFAHLSQRFTWFLEFKHEKIEYCCDDLTKAKIMRELPSIESEFRWLLDEFLSHFKLAFSLCERYSHCDIMYFVYEALVQMCLAKRTIFDQVCWTKLPANLNHLNEHLKLMEHQASVLEKIIFFDPLKLVENTVNPEEAYCGYVWLKFDLCLQHFRSLFDARLKGFQVDRSSSQFKQWLDWASNDELALEKLPLSGLDTETKAETYLFEKAKKKLSKFDDLMLDYDRLQGVNNEYDLLMEDLSID